MRAMNYQQVPFFRIFLSFVAGVILSQLFIDIWDTIIVGLFILIVTLVALQQIPKFWTIVFFLLSILSGFIHTRLFQSSSLATYYQSEELPINEYKGRVLDLKDKGARIHMTLEIYEIQSSPNLRIKEKIVMTVKNPSQELKALSFGDCIEFLTRLKVPQQNLNPGGFNYREYLKYQNIRYQCYLKTEDIKILGQNQGNTLLKIAHKQRKKFIASLKKYIHREQEFAIAAAMILGERDYLDKRLRNTFSETGSMHVLAVSGLHVGIVSMLLMLVLKIIPDRNRFIKILKTIGMLIGIWGFAMVTGLAPAVLRAATMFSFFMIGKLWTERINIYNVLFGSAFLMLLYDPLLVFNLSFQFSYLALFSIVYFYPLVSSFLVFNSFLANKIWDLVAVSISAQVLVFPLTVIYFHKFPVYFFLSGVIAIPIAFLVLCIGILLILNFVSVWLNSFLGILLQDVLSFFIWSMKGIQNLPNAVLQNIYLDTFSVLIFYLSCIVFMIQHSFNYRKKLLTVLAFLFTLLLYQNIKHTHEEKQEFIKLYHDRDELTIDCIKGHVAYSFQGLDKEFTHDFRNQAGIEKVVPLRNIEGSLGLQRHIDDNLNEKIQIVLISEIDQSDREKFDVVLIDQPFEEGLEQFLNMDSKYILLSNLNWKQYYQWLKILKRMNIEYYDLRMSGAIDLLEFTQKAKLK